MLVSGATSGIGLELARHYHREGWRLVLLGRRERSSLESSLFSSERYCRTDLTDPGAARTVVDFLDTHGVARLDVLIHNAGVGYYGPVAQQPGDSIRDLLQVNLRAPLALTHALLPRLLAQNDNQDDKPGGTVAFVGSVAANLPVPEYAVYGASKAALGGFARSLRVELEPHARVVVVHPGATRTDMHRKSGVPEDKFDTARFADARKVAHDIARAIETGRAETTLGVGNRGARALGLYLAPLLDRVLRWRQRRTS